MVMVRLPVSRCWAGETRWLLETPWQCSRVVFKKRLSCFYSRKTRQKHMFFVLLCTDTSAPVRTFLDLSGKVALVRILSLCFSVCGCWANRLCPVWNWPRAGPRVVVPLRQAGPRACSCSFFFFCHFFFKRCSRCGTVRCCSVSFCYFGAAWCRKPSILGNFQIFGMEIAKVTSTRRNRLARADSNCLLFFLSRDELAHAFCATMDGRSYWCYWWACWCSSGGPKKAPIGICFRKKPVLGRTQKDLIINLQHTRNEKPRRKSWRGRKKLLIFLVALVLATLDLASVWLLCIEFSKLTNPALPPDSRFGFERGRLH